MCKLLELPESFAEDSEEESKEEVVAEKSGGMVRALCEQCIEPSKDVSIDFSTAFAIMYEKDGEFKELCDALGFNLFCMK